MPLNERGPIAAIPADIRGLQRYLRKLSVVPNPNSVGPTEIQDDAVTEDKVDDDAIATSKIQDEAITNAKLRDSTAASVIGRSAATAGVPADIAFTVDNTFLGRRLGLVGETTLVDADIPASIARDAEVTAAISALSLASGVYTPTLTGVANVAASTAHQCQYLRVGSVVTVSGKVDIDPTAAAGAVTQLGISLPIASALATAEDCAGTAVAPGVAGQCAAILGDATNDRAQLEWKTADLTNQSFYFSFNYRII